MATATRHCDWCAHRRRYVEGKAESPPCELGHKPRFYYAQRNNPGVIPGWKRKCEDYKERTDDPSRTHD